MEISIFERPRNRTRKQLYIEILSMDWGLPCSNYRRSSSHGCFEKALSPRTDWLAEYLDLVTEIELQTAYNTVNNEVTTWHELRLQAPDYHYYAKRPSPWALMSSTATWALTASPLPTASVPIVRK